MVAEDTLYSLSKVDNKTFDYEKLFYADAFKTFTPIIKTLYND